MRISDLPEKVEAKAEGAIHDASISTRNALNGISELTDSLVNDGRDSAGRIATFMQKSSDGAVKAFRSNVQAQPSLMVALAAGAGVVIGVMLAARR